MTSQKKLGIWMDHANAHLLEFTASGGEEKVADTALTHEAKESNTGSSEHVIHNKEQQQKTEYYKKLGEAIRNFDEVVLFGPTNAKAELLNVLKADHRFENINKIIFILYFRFLTFKLPFRKDIINRVN